MWGVGSAFVAQQYNNTHTPPPSTPITPSFPINLLSLNLQGFSDLKMDALINIASVERAHVICLQETWCRGVGGLIGTRDFFVARCDCAVLERRRGVAIYIRRSIVMPGTVPCVRFADGGDGRVLVLDFIAVDGSSLSVASVYFPAASDAEKRLFVSSLPWHHLRGALVGCDSNLCITLCDKFPQRPSDSLSSAALLLRAKLVAFGLIDAFELLCDDDWRPLTCKPLGDRRGSCIDRFFVPSALTALTASVDVLPFVFGDHDCVRLRVAGRAPVPQLERRLPPTPTSILKNNTHLHDSIKQFAKIANNKLNSGELSSDAAWSSFVIRTRRAITNETSKQHAVIVRRKLSTTHAETCVV